jgi:hypothetical protein
MMKVLGRSWDMKKEYLERTGTDPLEFGDASREINEIAFREGAGDAAVIADIYVSSLGILNEGIDFAMSAYDVSRGNYAASIGLLPVVPGVVGRCLKKADGALDPIDPSKIRLVTKDGRRYLKYANKARKWEKLEEAVHDHHVFFRCLGGTDETNNVLSMQMVIHHRKQIGLHQHLLGHMRVKSYKGLKDKWRLAKKGKRSRDQFLDKLREGYSTFFKDSPDYKEIMEMIDKGLDL